MALTAFFRLSIILHILAFYSIKKKIEKSYQLMYYLTDTLSWYDPFLLEIWLYFQSDKAYL